MSDTFRIEDGVPYVGDKAFPWAYKVVETDVGDFPRRGFWLMFENGWTLSIQWGRAAYCGNYPELNSFLPESGTAEIAAWPAGGDLTRLSDDWPDTVLGWQSTDEVLRWIEDISSRSSAVPA